MKNRKILLKSLFLFLCIPLLTISSQARADFTVDAAWIAQNVGNINIEANAIILGSPGHPLLLKSKISGIVRANAGPDNEKVHLNFFAHSGSEIYVAADPYVGVTDPAVIDICSRADMNCTTQPMDANQFPKAHLKCQNGSWSVLSVTGVCVRPMGCCYINRQGNILVDHGCRPITAESQLSVINYNTGNSVNRCDATKFKNPKYKKFCVVNPDGTPDNGTSNAVTYHGGIGGNTGDDMFRLANGGDAILINENAANGNIGYPFRAALIEDRRVRPVNGQAPDIMIPAGPAGTFSDYIRFLSAPPAGVDVTLVGVQGGVPVPGGLCPPVSLSLCSDIGDALPEPPVVDGNCGLANDDPNFGGPAPAFRGPNGDGYYNFSDIPPTGLCAFGDVINARTRDNKFTWSCTPPAIISGGNTVSCETPRDTTARCGLAHDDPSRGGPAQGFEGPNGAGYGSVNDIPSNGFCEFGTVGFPNSQNESSFLSWTCTSPQGGPPANCKTPREENFDGICGLAHDDPARGGPEPGFDAYSSVSEIPDVGLCVFGTANTSAHQSDPNTIFWSCEPPNGVPGAETDFCQAPRAN